MIEDTIPRTDPFPVSPLQGGGAPVKTDLPGQDSKGVEGAKRAAAEQVHDAVDDFKEGATQAIESAKEAGSDFIQEQKEKLAETIEEYTHAVKAACDSLDAEEDNPLSGPAHRASRQLERASRYLRSKQPTDILHDLSDFARRRPELVFGGMFVAGMASVRFLKASSRGRHSSGPTGHTGSSSGFQRPRPAAPRHDVPIQVPAPVGPPPAFQTQNPNVLP
jgi:hypothetical protein